MNEKDTKKKDFSLEREIEFIKVYEPQTENERVKIESCIYKGFPNEKAVKTFLENNTIVREFDYHINREIIDISSDSSQEQ